MPYHHDEALRKEFAKARSEHDKTLLQRQISSTDRLINHLVYDLYGLTKEEIKLVEENLQQSCNGCVH